MRKFLWVKTKGYRDDQFSVNEFFGFQSEVWDFFRLLRDPIFFGLRG